MLNGHAKDKILSKALILIRLLNLIQTHFFSPVGPLPSLTLCSNLIPTLASSEAFYSSESLLFPCLEGPFYPSLSDKLLVFLKAQ